MKMNKIVLVGLAFLGLSMVAALLFGQNSPQANPAPGSPVLVELFTSEGCSSCPPADALLQELDTQPFSGTQLIVLSEHVDYWNHIGWTDPYSSHAYSERQSAYGRHLGLASVYTPQMIVDGTKELVGNSSREAKKVFDQAVTIEKMPVRISGLVLDGTLLRAHVEGGMLPASGRKAEVWFVVALNHAESQVARGENAGRRLTHVAVVRSMVKVGGAEAGKSFAQDVSVKLEPGLDPATLRVIAFVQEPGPGRVWGAVVQKFIK